MLKVEVFHDYIACQDDELTLRKGDIVKDVIKANEGWWEGVFNGKHGLFPSNFVQELKSPSNAEMDNENNHVASDCLNEESEEKPKTPGLKMGFGNIFQDKPTGVKLKPTVGGTGDPRIIKPRTTTAEKVDTDLKMRRAKFETKLPPPVPPPPVSKLRQPDPPVSKLKPPDPPQPMTRHTSEDIYDVPPGVEHVLPHPTKERAKRNRPASTYGAISPFSSVKKDEVNAYAHLPDNKGAEKTENNVANAIIKQLEDKVNDLTVLCKKQETELKQSKEIIDNFKTLSTEWYKDILNQVKGIAKDQDQQAKSLATMEVDVKRVRSFAESKWTNSYPN